MDVREIRVHGVSGTPADEMLGTDPTVVQQRIDGIQIYAPRPVDPEIRAYRWSSLTSGKARTALWIALLPFLLVNLAGWALPPVSRRLERVMVTCVRLAGLALTVVFTLVTAQGFIDVGSYQYLHGVRGWFDAGGAVAAGALVAALALMGLWVLLSQSAPTPERREEPTGRYRLTDRGMWDGHTVDRELRMLHLAAAYLAIGWIGHDAMRSLGWTAPRAQTVVTLVALPLVTATLAVRRSAGGSVGRSADGVALLATVALSWNVLSFASASTCVTCPATLRLTGHPMSWTVAVYGVLTVAILGLGFFARPRHNLATAPALLTIAGASGASVGAALVALSAAVTGGSSPHWIGQLATGYLTGVLVLVLVGAVVLAAGRDRTDGPVRVRVFRAVRRLRDHIDPLLWTVVAETAVMAAGFVGGRFGGWEFDIPPEVPSIVAVTVLVVLTWWLARHHWWRAAVILGIVSLGAVFLASTVAIDSFGGIPISFADYTATAVTLTVSIPLALMVGRVVGAVRNRDRRRGLAVAWDVGSFFPRWHHPFAPPPYGAAAVVDLADYVRSTADDEAVVVAGHSQGSVISLAALVAGDDPPRRTALFTFGSPLGSLYRRFFPLSFGDLSGLVEVLDGRWVNLQREDDPIAGPIDPGIDAPTAEDPEGRIHGGYWFEPEYDEIIATLRARLGSGG